LNPGVTFDVLVLGGGTAGCVLAARLSEDPARTVCLVEAGPDYGPEAAGRWPDDIRDARWLAFSHSWETDREDRSQLRARILGGCSAHNACVVLEGAPSDYDEWGEDWRYDAFRPYLDRARQTLRTRSLLREELSPWHRALADSADDDAILHDVNAVGLVRWNTAFAYIDGARDRPNLTILADTLVDRVLVTGDRALGAHTSAGELRADTVVVSAGAYGSPGILLRSGIGAERGLPVGEGLLDHVGVGAAWEPTDRLREETRRFEQEGGPLAMAQVTLRMRSRSCAEGTWDLFGFPAVERADVGYEISSAVFAMKPRSRGRVRLNGPDPRTPLVVEHGFLADERDAAVLTEGFEQLRELIDDPAIRRYAGEELRPGSQTSAAEHVRTNARGFFHPTGTCAIGSVVDNRGRVLGMEGLVVADASIMPTIPRSNTNLTVAAIAERLAETI
jgi:choline dehydrogenase-like flavoprotein